MSVVDKVLQRHDLPVASNSSGGETIPLRHIHTVWYRVVSSHQGCLGKVECTVQKHFKRCQHRHRVQNTSSRVRTAPGDFCEACCKDATGPKFGVCEDGSQFPATVIKNFNRRKLYPMASCPKLGLARKPTWVSLSRLFRAPLRFAEGTATKH